MPHETPLIAIIAVGLVLAFLLGSLAYRLKMSPIVGYLIAGILAGPFTPGFVGDPALATELAEIGVILLMFGVGLHFSLADLLKVKNIAIPGALVQIGLATTLGWGLAWMLGWSVLEGIVFGLALSGASTVVLLRALEDQRLLDTKRGQIAVGWLIVEDLAMVLVLVLLPSLAAALVGNENSGATMGTGQLLTTLAWTLGKMAAFVALMLIVGRRLIPWLLERVAGTGERELFTLAVLAIALGVAVGSAKLFDVSFALGAFFAGMLLNESELSHKAASDSLPMRDAFAVLFFVSVGMLFDPMVLVHHPLPVLATFLIITVGKSVASFLIVRAFGHPNSTALTISASLAQIGEFSFILLGLGITLELLPTHARDIVLAGAILSILLNPFLFAWLDRRASRPQEPDATTRDTQGASGTEAIPEVDIPLQSTDHVILVGGGRNGSLVAQRLQQSQVPLVIVELDTQPIERLRGQGHTVIRGNAVLPDTLAQAGITRARALIVAIPNSFEAGEIIASQRAAHTRLPILACAYLGEEVAWLRKQGASQVANGAAEIASRLISLLPEASPDEAPDDHPRVA